ncbi:MAG TPA: alpha-L-fucosidase [Tepidisphaeraceae bacterium]
MKNPWLLLALVAFFISPLLAADPLTTAHETDEQFMQRTAWWRQAKFGMFIHWGIYAVPADSSKGVAEWYMHDHQVQVKDYEPFAKQFNPAEFDARKWVKIAKAAGMKYIVITSKHHDGFAMFDTKLNDYSVVKATPWAKDPMKDLAQACREESIKFCFYHSVMDWHHADYLPRRKWEEKTRPADGADLNRYIDFMKGQLTELLTNYGELGGIWFDGSWEHNAGELRSEEVNRMIRKLQPNILINDRNRLKEDYDTPEQKIPKEKLEPGRLWETCMTMNNTWGYSKTDNNWKSAQVLVRNLIDCASKGGNFLLNVGPDEKGNIPAASIERLESVGKWMEKYGDSVYGTTASPYDVMPFDGRTTVKADKLYVHVFEWPEAGVKVPGIKTKVKGAKLLGAEEIEIDKRVDHGLTDLTIHRPARTDPYSTVVEVQLEGPLFIDRAATRPAEK